LIIIPRRRTKMEDGKAATQILAAIDKVCLQLQGISSGQSKLQQDIDFLSADLASLRDDGLERGISTLQDKPIGSIAPAPLPSQEPNGGAGTPNVKPEKKAKGWKKKGLKVGEPGKEEGPDGSSDVKQEKNNRADNLTSERDSQNIKNKVTLDLDDEGFCKNEEDYDEEKMQDDAWEPLPPGANSKVSGLHQIAKWDDRGQDDMNRDLATRRLHAKLGHVAPGHMVKAEELFATVETLSLGAHGNAAAAALCLNDIVQLVTSLNAADTSAQHVSVHMSPAGRHPSTTVTIAFFHLVDMLLLDDEDLQMKLGLEMQQKFKAFKQILLASDADIIVAELMAVRVNDLAAPNETVTMYETVFEPLVGIVIMLNGAYIGVQADPDLESGVGMVVLEVLFTIFFVAELVIKLKINGWWSHFFGPDHVWNCFDFIIVFIAVFDLFFSAMNTSSSKGDTGSLTIIRLVRLTRLTRLIKILKFSWMADLILMVKGLWSGLKTLFWAVCLLFFMIYVIAVFLTIMLGNTPTTAGVEFETERRESFSTVPKSMFTTFRCLLVVDCTTSQGKPLLTMMFTHYGFLVVMTYVFCYVIIGIGVMNLIMAIYIENTLDSAKKIKGANRLDRNKESIRIARQMKALTVKLLACQKKLGMRGDSLFNAHTSVVLQEVMNSESMRKEVMHAGFQESSLDITTPITREIFMLAIQDPIVQRLMDDLDIPPGRAQLFEVFDADSSGEVMPMELVNGLLKVRGEAQRSDIIAPMLGVRAIQTKLRQMEDSMVENQKHIVKIIADMIQLATSKKSTSERGTYYGPDGRPLIRSPTPKTLRQRV